MLGGEELISYIIIVTCTEMYTYDKQFSLYFEACVS